MSMVPGMPGFGEPAGMAAPMPPMDMSMGMQPTPGEFVLNMGDSLEEMVPVTPAAAGVYTLLAGEVQVQMTKAGEAMVVVQWNIADPGEEQGKSIRDSRVIPGEHRKQESSKGGQDKWTVMMNMLRDWLEAITGNAWRSDSMSLNPERDILGIYIQAQVELKPWTNKEKGTSGYQNELGQVLRSMGRSPNGAGPMGMPSPAGGMMPPQMPVPTQVQQAAPQMPAPQMPPQMPAPQAQPQIDPTEPPAPMPTPQPEAEQVPNMGQMQPEAAPSVGLPAPNFDV